MFRVSVTFRTGSRTMVASGPRRALAQLREWRAHYGVEPQVSDGKRRYSEAELAALAEEGD
jgi:hypothetical protein